jgi:hypothetical protein
MSGGRGLESFQSYKDLSGPGIGTVTVLKNDRSEFLLRKTLDRSLKKHFNHIQTKAKRLLSQSFQQVVTASSMEDEIYFEFSKRNLEDHLNACIQKDMIVSEEDLWSLMKSLAESGQLLEKLGEYHPSLTLQNIFRLNDRFKLLNPYVFDSYIEEAIAVERLSGNESKHKSSTLSKSKVNLIQTACIILCMGILMSERELKSVQKEGKIARLLLQFQERYSARFANLVEDVIYRRVDSFVELFDKMEGSPSKRDSVKTEIGISPPIDFDADLFATIGESRHPVRSRDKHGSFNQDKSANNIPGGKRFLGADGVVRTPTRKPEQVAARISPPRRGEALPTDEADYKLIEKKKNYDYNDLYGRERESNRRVDFDRDTDVNKGGPKPADRAGVSSITSSPKGNRRHEIPLSKSYKEIVSHASTHPSEPLSKQMTAHPSDKRFASHTDDLDPQLAAFKKNKGSFKNQDNLNVSETKAARHREEEAKTVSAQQFYSRTADEGAGGGVDRENRVAAIYSRLNKRFKQYHPDGGPFEEPHERQRQAYDLVKSPKADARPKGEPQKNHEVPRNSRAADDGLYSPFNWSNTKKQIREEKEDKYTPLYNRQPSREHHATDHPKGDRFRLNYEPRSVQESPKYAKQEDPYQQRTKKEATSGHYRPQFEEDKYERYMRRNTSTLNHQLTDDTDFNDTDKKKNRSVSFNLSNDLSRSFASKPKGPKSILKKTGPDEVLASAEKQKRQLWKQETDRFYDKYSHGYYTNPRDDFKIETKYMGGEPRGHPRYYETYEDLKSGLETGVTRSPGYRNFDYRR